MISPFDIVLAIHLCGRPRDSWTFASLASELGVSTSAVHRSVKTLQEAGLYDGHREVVFSVALLEFLQHAVKYLVPARFGAPTRGLVTGPFAPPLAEDFAVGVTAAESRWVWPFRGGETAGISLLPIHECVPRAAAECPGFYRRLALVDTLRAGRSREVSAARRHLAIELGLDEPQWMSERT